MKVPKPKINPAVAAAEQLVADKFGALVEARALVKQREHELNAAREEVYKARLVADAALPRCRVVIVARGKVESGTEYVILRKTPGGRLYVRRPGHESDGMVFKWRCDRFVEERGGLLVVHLELRDVPPEFMPAGKEA